MNKYVNQRTLITGSGGMVGGNIAALAKNNEWDIFTPNSAELDLTDPKSTFEFLLDNKIDSVIHCAAKVGGISANINAPADFILDNLRIDSSLASAARNLKIRNYLYFGSSCMYPKNSPQPMGVHQILTSPLEPTNEGYALSKISGAKTVTSVARQDGLNWKVLIPSNLYGPKDNFNLETSHLIPAIIRKVYTAIKIGQGTIEIWGDGQARREFTFVGDVAHFVISEFHKMYRWPEMLNIGYGKDYSIDEYYAHVAKYLGYQGIFKHNLNKPAGMARKLMDSSIASEYGWNPATDLEQGIKITTKWFLENAIHE